MKRDNVFSLMVRMAETLQRRPKTCPFPNPPIEKSLYQVYTKKGRFLIAATLNHGNTLEPKVLREAMVIRGKTSSGTFNQDKRKTHTIHPTTNTLTYPTVPITEFTNQHQNTTFLSLRHSPITRKTQNQCPKPVYAVEGRLVIRRQHPIIPQRARVVITSVSFQGYRTDDPS